MAVFCKSNENALSRVFLHAELISELKIEQTPMVFEKSVKNRKNIYYHYFLFFL